MKKICSEHTAVVADVVLTMTRYEIFQKIVLEQAQNVNDVFRVEMIQKNSDFAIFFVTATACAKFIVRFKI